MSFFFKRKRRKRRKEKRKWLLSVAGEIECKIIWNKHRSCFNRPCSSNGRNFLSDLLPSVPISRRLLPISGFTVILDGSRSIQKRINTRWIKIFEAERAEQRFLSPWKKREKKNKWKHKRTHTKQKTKKKKRKKKRTSDRNSNYWKET